MTNTLPMDHKRKRSYGSLPETSIIHGHVSGDPRPDLSNANENEDARCLNASASSADATIPWNILASENALSSASSEASSQCFPLTKQNLRQFINNNNNKALGSTPDSESHTTETTATSTSTTRAPGLVRRDLNMNNLFVSDRDAVARATDLIEKARAIVTAERHSALTKEQGESLLKTAMQYETVNDMTLLVNVWSKLSQPGRANRWDESAREKAHLKANWKDSFKRRSVPPLVVRDPALQSFAKHAPRVKNPRPDITYGFHQRAFSPCEQYINGTYGAALSNFLDHPFFVVELVGVTEPLEKAENQCARSGSAMVRLKRRFDCLAEGTYHKEEAQHRQEKDGEHLADQTSHKTEKTPVGHHRIDTKSFAFSLAIHSSDATMFVHWAEETFSKDEKLLTINWHATPVAQYLLRNPEGWIDLHHDLENVLDWGVLTRKQELKELCSQIFEREQKEKGKEKQKT